MLGLLGSMSLTAIAECVDQRNSYWQHRLVESETTEELMLLKEHMTRVEARYIALVIVMWSEDRDQDGWELYKWNEEEYEPDVDVPGEARYPDNLALLATETPKLNLTPGPYYVERGFYPNPYTSSGLDRFNARQVPFGWTVDAVGNFTYLKQYDYYGEVTGFVLISWGPDPAAGLDVDGDGSPDGALAMHASRYLLDRNGAWIDTLDTKEQAHAIPVMDGDIEIDISCSYMRW